MWILQNKYFWISIAVIILLVVVKQNWYRIKRLIQTTDVTLENGESITIPETRQIELKDYARKMYVDLKGCTLCTPDYKLYEYVVTISDLELKFLSQYYKNYISKGVWLYQDVDDAYFIGSDLDVQLMSRLSKVGERA